MDEADRMIDMGFEEDVRTIFSFFQVCILLFINIISHTLIFNNCSLFIIHLYFRDRDKHCYFQLLCQKKFKILLDQL